MLIPDWVPDAVVYQIFPDRFRNGDPMNDPPGTEPWGGIPTRENYFGGDLAGVIQALDYIADLGATAIYLNPIFKAGSNHKYDTYDYFTIDPAFGNDATFDQLIREAHARGIRIILDGVFNHCGIGFSPFQDLIKNGASSRYKDWFFPYSFPICMEPYPNYATCGGAAFLPKLNTRNPEVEAFVHRVALYWLARGIDGWRLDVAYEIHPVFWRRFRKIVKDRYPDAYLVAEEWRDPSPLLQSDMFDGATHYQLRDLLLDFFVRNSLSADSFARALETLRRRLPPGAEWGMLTFLGNHDTPRIFTVCEKDATRVVLMFAFILTYPGVPLIYYGD
ncbi:MAG: glycoside hydrolase family 13 protein, partial [Chloroflexi bacterium]|nr:glycoside hydrolase family 13 protein [Chloroflexota bacterium]